MKDILGIFILVILLLLSGLEVNGQDNDSIPNQVENSWIEKFDNQMVAEVSVNNAYEIFEVKTPSDRFVIYPNIPTNLRFKVSYRFLSIGFQLAPDFIPGNGDNELKGKTKSFSIGTALVFKHWFTDISYSKVNGYYLENTIDYNPSWSSGDPYLQFPDLHYGGIALSLGYSTNENFSIRNLTTQTERQVKSTGSFIPVFNFRYYTMDDQSIAASTQKTKNFETSIGPGYAYTFVIQRYFYLSMALIANLGYLDTELITRQQSGDVITRQNNFIFRGEGRTGIGYNKDRFYTGLYATASSTRYEQGNTSVINHETGILYHIFIGIRFNSPNFIKRNVDKINSRISMN
jgi:hypothetical protein